ncbi:SDR family NAD(P)-dependent oxidoreductase [Pseudoduganella sp. DS3]|uniref:SDR family NAD(P)-dependent oxidoreductase n=1 Tax=Pseudoduganella guangdongensis TaxID=2692179 RepID=A0A6N9HH87_9BURK|nr:oxidoreductase [Pseudoduganella guangdongensis]MYN02463.1 SDR family NAD(P)-dependent oxidoreductase [Pseudoduganella guangdongensis]
MANKVWFITGASRGFGLLIARDALARGDAVVAAARNPQAIVDALGVHPKLLALQLDVTKEAAAVVAAHAAIERFGRIDVLVNNAGYGILGAVEETSADEVRRNYDTNVFGLLNVSRAVLPHMRRQRSGHVINISSLGGYQAYHGWGVYGSTKFAVEGLSEAMAQELAPLGVHVTVVEPGFFRTDFLDAASLVETQARIEDYQDTVGAMREFAAGANHAQPGDPAKLARAMLKLADAAQPPLRLQLGSDAVARAYAKHQQVERELAQWKELALSTDFEPAQLVA